VGAIPAVLFGAINLALNAIMTPPAIRLAVVVGTFAIMLVGGVVLAARAKW
jgi:hypothetical protein